MLSFYRIKWNNFKGFCMINNNIEINNNLEIAISVIIPVYNVDEYLHECIESVINQKLKTIEIICIDDGSTDKSLDVLRYYQNIDNRIKIIQQKNSGAGVARNNGLKIAKGEYIAFLDPDDFYPDDKTLNSLFIFAKKNNYNITGGNINIITDSKCNICETDKIRLENRKKRMLESIIEFKYNGNMRSDEYCSSYNFWRFIYKNIFLKENDITFPSFIRFQDPPFLAKALICESNIGILKSFVYSYRMDHKIVKNNFKKYNDSLLGVSTCLNLFDIHNKNVQYTLMFKEFLERSSWKEENKLSSNEIIIINKIIFNIYENIKKEKIKISLMDMNNKVFLKKLHKLYKEELDFKKEFLKRTLKHIRLVQDNLLLLELYRGNLPFYLPEFELIRSGFRHDTDKFEKSIVKSEIEITKFWYYKRNNINNPKTISKNEVENISKKHYANSKHHIEYYRKNSDISFLVLCEIACDMAAICQEYKFSQYTKYLLESRNSKYKILSNFQIKTLVYLLNILKFLYVTNNSNI